MGTSVPVVCPANLGIVQLVTQGREYLRPFLASVGTRDLIHTLSLLHLSDCVFDVLDLLGVQLALESGEVRVQLIG